jgi:hypothetical protein
MAEMSDKGELADPWMPIDTCPVNLNTVDIWVKWWDHKTDTFRGARVTDCYQQNEDGKFVFKSRNGSMILNSFPTHWMRAPCHPKGSVPP